MIDLRYAVICIDDDPLILQVLAFQLNKILDTKSILIEYYTNPSTAINEIDALVDDKIDIIFVLVDYQMPEMTGVDLVRKIKAKYPALNCIMLSGQANQLQVSELEKDNLLEEFIEKPWGEAELKDAVMKILNRKEV
jgi:two-component system response regulator YesN